MTLIQDEDVIVIRVAHPIVLRLAIEHRHPPPRVGWLCFLRFIAN